MKRFLKITANVTALAVVGAVALTLAADHFVPRQAKIAPPNAERIMFDGGGRLDRYIDRVSALREEGTLVVIDGQCISACTMLTNLAPEKLCVTSHGMFVFHSAFSRSETTGEKEFAKDATEIMWHFYPKALREALVKRGWNAGERNDMIFMEADELQGIIRSCTPADLAKLKSV